MLFSIEMLQEKMVLTLISSWVQIWSGVKQSLFSLLKQLLIFCVFDLKEKALWI